LFLTRYPYPFLFGAGLGLREVLIDDFSGDLFTIGDELDLDRLR
jgi:hypothetical protein